MINHTYHTANDIVGPFRREELPRETAHHPYMSLYDSVLLFPNYARRAEAKTLAKLEAMVYEAKQTLEMVNRQRKLFEQASASVPPKKRWLSLLAEVATVSEPNHASPVTKKRKRDEPLSPPPEPIESYSSPRPAKTPKICCSVKSYDRLWMTMYERLVAYKNEFGTTKVPQRYKADPQLGRWVNWNRTRCKGEERIALLNKIGFEWNACSRTDWDAMYERLKDYKARFGTTNVPKKFREDPQLGTWVHTQRQDCKCPERVAKMNAIGFEWRLIERSSWNDMYDRLVAYKREHQTTHVPKRYEKDPKLARWVQTQRMSCKKPERINLLNAIGFEWDGRKAVSVMFIGQ